MREQPFIRHELDKYVIAVPTFDGEVQPYIVLANLHRWHNQVDRDDVISVWSFEKKSTKLSLGTLEEA